MTSEEYHERKQRAGYTHALTRPPGPRIFLFSPTGLLLGRPHHITVSRTVKRVFEFIPRSRCIEAVPGWDGRSASLYFCLMFLCAGGEYNNYTPQASQAKTRAEPVQ